MSDFATLKSQFAGDLVTSTDPNYANSIARWTCSAQRRAKVVAFVKTPEDVALAIAYARANKLEIAIRGGGHNPGGASSTEGGLVIDLSKYFDGVRVDEKERLAYAGGGALWEAVDREGIKHGLATVAGTVNHTGVGGLTLGGGYGWLSARHGLAIDNLVQATVVTASGSILTASSTSNPDLFFGIRGGCSNFGVVTEFVYRLHPQRKTVYSGPLIFSPEKLEGLVSLTQEWLQNVGEDEAMLQLITVGPDGNPAILVFVFYNGSEDEGRKCWKKFLDLGPVVDQTGEIPYEKLNSLQNAFVHHGQGFYMKGIAQRTPHYPTALAAHKRVIEIYNSSHSPSSTTPKLRPAILFEYFPLNKVTSIPRDETAFRRNPASSILLFIGWDPTSPADADLGENERKTVEKARDYTKELISILNQGLDDLTETEKLGYTNYDPDAITGEGAAELVEGKVKATFAENYPRLQQVKKKYDPERLFNKWFPITPAA